MSATTSGPAKRSYLAAFTRTAYNLNGVQQAAGPGPYTFVVPANVSALRVNACGAGGGGGGGFATAGGGGGGGGGGMQLRNEWVSVTPGETVTVTVGAAGTASS